MPNTAANPLGALRDLIAEIGAEKRATEGLGKTTFPQESVDDGTTEATSGSHAAENTAYVKKTVPGTPIDSAPDAKASDPKQDDLQPQIRVTQSTTGTDPSTEDNYKDKKYDPGTDHPARADNGEKYAGWNFDRLVTQLEKVGNGLLADLHVEAKQATATSRGPATAKGAAAAGYSAATAAGIGDEERARLTLESTVKEAFHMADLIAAYCQIKYAEEEEERREHELPRDVESHDGPPDEGVPMPPDAGVPPAGGGDPMAQLLGGGEQPPEVPPTGDESMQGLNGAMDDMQITPELIQQLLALLQSQGQGHPALKAAAENLKEATTRARTYRLQGKYETGPAKTARVGRIRSECRGYLSELMKSAGIIR